MRLFIKKCLPLLMGLVLLLTGCGQDFDASGYVQAILDLNFQGDTTKAREMMEDVSYSDLMTSYQESIDTFVQSYLVNGLDINETKQGEIAEVVAQIFQTMRYNVGEAKKVEDGVYEVPVQIWPTDVLIRFNQMMVQDSLVLAQDVEEGKYEGTEEEIQEQLMIVIGNHACELLGSAYLDMEYGDPETVVLTLEEDSNHDYAIRDEDMANLMMQILRLDEIQG